MAAVAPAQLDTRTVDLRYGAGDGEVDSKGDEDTRISFPIRDTPASELQHKAESLSGESESASEDEADAIDKDEEEEEEDVTEAVKLSNGRVESDEEVVEEDMLEAEASSVEGDDSAKSSSDAESAAVEEWDGGSEGPEDASVEVANRNNCIFCGQDEEHDPSEEYEEYMACAVCGDNSHRKCARDAKSLSLDDDLTKWRCPDCVENALEPENQEETVSRRRSSTSKFTRDLLPAQRGVSRPGSHSVFNTLILDDDPLDGSRSLRKRKASSEKSESTTIPNKRRRRQETSKSASRASTAPTLANENLKGSNASDGFPTILDETVDAGSTSTRKSRSSRPSRSRISRISSVKSAIVVKHTPRSIILAIRLSPSKLSEILESLPKKKRRRAARRPPAEAEEDNSRPTPSFSAHYATPFYSFHERENDDLKSKPYGGILSEADADTSKTLPLGVDRARFNDARQKAEEEWKLKTATLEAEVEIKGRSSQKLAGPPSKIKCVNFGGYEIETWYAAPYPEEYSRNRVLYICEFCLKYMNSDYVAWRHKLKCPAKHPPGDEIYRSTSISVFEVDGRKNPVYCQNLCLLAKLFLGSKTLYYDVEPFLFYVMTEYDEFGCHFVGYFSKEKRPSSQNNVSCILTLPTHQRKGYGNLLISFSYLLTRVEGKTGSPEKPLSDMGLVSYRNYWRLVLSYELLNQTEPLSIVDLSDRTGMTADDIVAALEGLRALVRDPITKAYALRLDYAYYKQCIKSWEAKGYVTIDPKALVWTPYLMGHSNLAHYDRAPPLPTVAPREGDEDDKQAQPGDSVQQIVATDSAAVATEVSDIHPNKANGELDYDVEDLPKVNGFPNAAPTHPAEETVVGKYQDLNSTIAPSAERPTLASQAATPIASKVLTSTPPLLANGTLTPLPLCSIPAVRYEVFPPIPGTASRRRGGWRGGPRRSTAKNGKNTPTNKASQTPLKRGGKALSKGLGIGKGKGMIGKSPRNRSANGNSNGHVNGGKSTGRRTRLSGMMDLDADEQGEEGKSKGQSEGKQADGALTTTQDSIDPDPDADADAAPDPNDAIRNLETRIQDEISQEMIHEEDDEDEEDEDEEDEDEIEAEEEEQEEAELDDDEPPPPTSSSSSSPSSSSASEDEDEDADVDPSSDSNSDSDSDSAVEVELDVEESSDEGSADVDVGGGESEEEGDGRGGG